MRSNYLTRQNYLQRNQQEPLREDQVQNNAGGYTWEVDKWKFLRRFLILGSEGGTYYINEGTLTRDNVRNVEACIKKDPKKALDMIFELRDLAPKRSPIFYALALTFTLVTKTVDNWVRDGRPKPHESVQKSLDTLDDIHTGFCKIVRTGSDLLEFVSYIDTMRGWGRSLQSLVSLWYATKFINGSIDGSLEYQVLKYQNRHGWTHKDVLRKCHYDKNFPNARNNIGLFRWIVGADTGKRLVRHKDSGVSVFYPETAPYPDMVAGYEQLKQADDLEDVLMLIKEHRFTHEMIPNRWKNEPKLWDVLLEKMPVTAMIRNLAKMTQVGLLSPMNPENGIVIGRLKKDVINKAKVHPIQMLMAYLTYKAGKGKRGSLTWEPVQQIVDALEAGFYHAFDNVEPTNNRILVAIDVSTSMTLGEVAGCVGLTPALASAALAMVTARTEPNYHIMGFAHEFKPLGISASDSLESALQKVQEKRFGGTDCALPMTYARFKDMEVDAFMVLTDTETWYGSIHPAEALAQYRKSKCSEARLAVVAMVSSRTTIADPKDPGMLDAVGFDAGLPRVLRSFFTGEIYNV